MTDYFKSMIASLLVTGLILANVYADIGDQDVGKRKGSWSLSQKGASRVDHEFMRLDVETAIKHGDISYLKKFDKDHKGTNPADLGLEGYSWHTVIQRLINDSTAGNADFTGSFQARTDARQLFVKKAFATGDIDFITELSKGDRDPRYFGLEGSWAQVMQEMRVTLITRIPLKE